MSYISHKGKRLYLYFASFDKLTLAESILNIANGAQSVLQLPNCGPEYGVASPPVAKIDSVP